MSSGEIVGWAMVGLLVGLALMLTIDLALDQKRRWRRK